MDIICLVDLIDAPFDQDFSEELKLEEWRTEAHVLSALKKLGHKAELFGVSDDVWPLLEKIRSKKPDLIFNLCEAFRGERRFEATIPALLELLGVSYTGARALTLDLCKDKGTSKILVERAGVSVPHFSVLNRDGPGHISPDFSFPAIVKPLALEASTGIAQSSVVQDAQSARERAAFISKKYGQDAILEEFIDGPELYVGVLAEAGHVLEMFYPRELCFGRAFKRLNGLTFATFKAKWDESYRERWGIRTKRADALTGTELKAVAQCVERVCMALGASGPLRVDLRLDRKKSRVVFLEANPNPALARDEEFALSARASGVSYNALISKILMHALGGTKERLVRNRSKASTKEL